MVDRNPCIHKWLKMWKRVTPPDPKLSMQGQPVIKAWHRSYFIYKDNWDTHRSWCTLINWTIPWIPQCTCRISHNTSLWNRNVHNHAYAFSRVHWQAKATTCLTHRGPVDLRKWAIFNTKLMSPKSSLSQEDLDAGCEHSMVPVDS